MTHLLLLPLLLECRLLHQKLVLFGLEALAFTKLNLVQLTTVTFLEVDFFFFKLGSMLPEFLQPLQLCKLLVVLELFVIFFSQFVIIELFIRAEFVLRRLLLPAKRAVSEVW